MSNTSTTTTPAKVAKPRKSRVSANPRPRKPYTRLELVREVEAMGHGQQDGGYLADLVSGARKNETLGPVAKQAAQNLTERATRRVS